MPKFVIEREIAGAGRLTDEEIREASLASLTVLRQLGPEIQWIHSYVTDDKIYCIYYAPDEFTIREHARLASIPVDRVSAVRRMLDPANFAAS
jgi:Nickel responsive protein SCO4226-like